MPLATAILRRHTVVVAIFLVGLALAAVVLLGAATSSGADRPKLTWAPPSLSNPQTVVVSAGQHELRLSPDQDYIVRLPKVPLSGPNGLVINGGHDVVLIGGEINISGAASVDEISGRCLAIFGATGTVHIEGLRCSGPQLFEGIQNYSTAAVLQIENVTIDRVGLPPGATLDVGHPDLVQLLAGKRVRIDGLTGTSSYQGIFLARRPGRLTSADLRRVDIRGAPGAQYLLWQQSSNIRLRLRSVNLKPAPGRAMGRSVWPDIAHVTPRRRARRSGRTVRWGARANIDGVVRRGPPHGSQVVRTQAGVGYRSPGYAR